MSTGPIVVRACDVEEPDARAMEVVEAAYRRGVHQALAFACDLVGRSGDHREAERRLADAADLAGELRACREDEGGGALLDHMARVLHRRWEDES
jgi:hypothetical protein